jgi:hypothetical protein
MRHEIIWHDGYVEIKLFGQATLQGYKDQLIALLNDPRWRPGFPILSDDRELEDMNTRNLDYTAISNFSGFVKQHEDRIGDFINATVLSGEDEHPVLVGLWESTLKYYGYAINSKIFTSYEDAVSWLVRQKQREASGS